MDSNGVHDTSDDPSLTGLAARRLYHIASNPIPPQLREKVNLAVLDYLGAIASGLQAPWASAVCQYARSRRGVPEAHAWGVQQDVTAETAAFVNATLAHSAIRDDMHLKSNSHIGSIVISAAMALAQRNDWTGEQLLKAIIGGYEVAALLGVAVQQSPGYNRHARPSGIVGAFGAAGAAVTASFVHSDMDEDTAINALGFAANMASGYNEWAWAGGLEIYTEMGSASQAGIVASDLARSGMKCSDTLLEGRAGLFAALGASQGEALFRQRLESEVGQGLLDVRFKPVPGCNYAQTPLAVALNLATRRKFDAGAVAAITVICTDGAKNYPGCDNPGPFTNVQQTKMSIQFGVCAVLLHGAVSEDLFKKFGDESITTLVRKCVIQTNPDLIESFKQGRQPARIEVELADGARAQEELVDVPWLDSQAVLERFHGEARSLLRSEEVRRKVVNTIETLDEAKSCKSLLALFRDAFSLTT